MEESNCTVARAEKSVLDNDECKQDYRKSGGIACCWCVPWQRDESPRKDNPGAKLQGSCDFQRQQGSDTADAEQNFAGVQHDGETTEESMRAIRVELALLQTRRLMRTLAVVQDIADALLTLPDLGSECLHPINDC